MRFLQTLPFLRRFAGKTDFVSSALSVAEALIVLALQLATYLVLVRIADTDAVAIWMLVMSLLSVARAADMVSQGLVSFVAQQRSLGEMKNAHSYVTTTLLLGALGYALVGLFAFVALIYAVPYVLEPEQALALKPNLVYCVLTFWISSLTGIFRLSFLGFERFGLKVTQNIGSAFVFLPYAWLLVPVFGLKGIMLAQLAQSASAFLFACVCYFGWIAKGERAHLWRADIAGSILSYGWKSMTVSSLQLTIEPIIRLLANHFGGLSGVLVVELASRSIMAARTLLLSVGQVLIPKFSQDTTEQQRSVDGEIARLESAYFGLGLAMMLGCVGLAPVFAALIPAVSASQLTIVSAIIAATWFFNIMAAPTFFLLFGRRRARSMLKSNLLMTGGAVVLGIAGGWFWSLYGALAGVACGFLLSCVYQMVGTRDLTGERTSANRKTILMFGAPTVTGLSAIVITAFFLILQIRQPQLSFLWWLFCFGAVVPAGLLVLNQLRLWQYGVPQVDAVDT